MHSGHQEKATGDQIRSSRITVLCMSSPSRASNESALPCSTIRRKSIQEGTTLQESCHCRRKSMRQHTDTTRDRSAKICTIPRLPSFWETCSEKLIWVDHVRAYFILIIQPIITILSFAQQTILIVASWLFSRGENHLDQELRQDFGATRVSARRTKERNKLRTVLTPRLLKSCSEKQLGRAFQIRKILAIQWLHLRTMKFVNPDECWSSRTEISGYDPQIYPDTFLFLWLFVRCPFKIATADRLRSWKPGAKPRSRRLRKTKGRLGHSRMEPVILDLDCPHLLPLLGTNGAQTKRVRVLSGSQLIGTAQNKRAEILHGRHLFSLAMRSSTQILSIRASMATKITSVCYWRLHFATTATCTSDVACTILFPVCVTDMTFCLNFQWFFVDCFWLKAILLCARWTCFSNVRQVTIGRLWDFPCIHYTDWICQYRPWPEKESYISLWVLGCLFPRFSSRTSCTYRTLFIHTQLALRQWVWLSMSSLLHQLSSSSRSLCGAASCQCAKLVCGRTVFHVGDLYEWGSTALGSGTQSWLLFPWQLLALRWSGQLCLFRWRACSGGEFVETVCHHSCKKPWYKRMSCDVDGVACWASVSVHWWCPTAFHSQRHRQSVPFGCCLPVYTHVTITDPIQQCSSDDRWSQWRRRCVQHSPISVGMTVYAENNSVTDVPVVVVEGAGPTRQTRFQEMSRDLFYSTLNSFIIAGLLNHIGHAHVRLEGQTAWGV